MLRLKQIDLVGFKSFCNRERLRFAGSGIATVVGPNGCGKSNICDAISWVLGEQSAKSLRGGRMQDVIFAGTRNRKPSGMAKVTLTLHDPDGMLERLFDSSARPGAPKIPVSHASKEIEVTRKLFSNGASQYILNSKTVRLRDVQDLFLGTGLGPNHYAIIEQGRIGQLLAARSLERRAFVEEAAGVTRFKSRRKLAELKLANTQLNLERVHDILQEVARQANSLKRQADRAERYETYREQLRAAQCLLFASRFRHLESKRSRLDAEVAAAKQRLAALSGETERMESEFAGKREREQEWEAQLEVERDELSVLRIDEERMRERIEQQARTIADNRARQQRASQDLEAASSRVEELQESALAEQGNVVELRGVVNALRHNLGTKELECAAQQSSMSDVNASREACRGKTLSTLDALSDAKGRLGKLEETLAGYDMRLTQARTRRAEAQTALESAENRRQALASAAAVLAQRVQQMTARRDSLRHAVAERRTELGSLRNAAETQRAEASGLSARRDSIREMLRHRAYSTGAVKDIFDAIEDNPQDGFRPLGVLADFLEVDAGYEKAVEQFLGEDLEHVVVGDWAEAGRGVQLVRDEFAGRAAFLLVAGGSQSAPAARARVPDGAAPLLEHARLVARDGGSVPGLLPKLRDGFMVGDAQTAERLAGLHPTSYFVLPDGTWYQGDTVQGGPKASSGPLVLKQQLRELTPQLQAVEQGLAAAKQEIESDEDSVRRDGAELEAVLASVQNIEKEALAVEHDLKQAGQAITDSRQAGDSLSEEIQRLGVDRVRTETHREQALRERAGLEADYEAAQALSAELADESRDGQAELMRLQEERTTLRTEAAAMEERLRATVTSLQHAEAAVAEHRTRLAELQRQIERWAKENADFARSNAALEAQVASAADRQPELQRRIAETSKRLHKSRARTTSLIEAVRDQRAEVEAARQKCSTKEIELARLQADLEHLASDCSTELGAPIAKIAESAPEQLSDEMLHQAEEQHEEIRDKIDRLGPVNVLARREYEQVSERKAFLETQQQDLLDSIRNTWGAIREIDTACRERFEAAFDAINENFRSVFATLFGGGIGELRLSDPDDRDESGIEIVAQPPGKRLQNVALLSGGEKSLTVMALLMSTFRYQPSPFCVLDEADSQLDEANTIRLRGLIQEMAPETQFLVITHSKTMMEAAETLYGVTMGEAGVSELVSVRMAGHGIAGHTRSTGETQPVAVVA